LHNLVRDGAIGDVEAGDAAEARVMLVDEARERALVASAHSASITPASSGATTCAAPESLAASIIPASSTLRVSRSCPCGALSLTRGPDYRHKSA